MGGGRIVGSGVGRGPGAASGAGVGCGPYNSDWDGQGGQAPTAAAERQGAPRGSGGRRRRTRSKAALVLGGGGFTGGVYEIGALRALDLLSVNRTVNEFDVYVGTSAGAFVASAVANGVTPEEMMRVIVQQVPTAFPDARVSSLLRPNYSEFVRKGLLVPFRLAQLVRSLARDLGQLSAVDIAVGLAEVLPSGLYSEKGIERYVRTILSDPDRTDDFRLLQNELYIAATDLDTCERIVFGAEDWDDVPISTAVAASGALPMIYKPVRVKDRELVDGGIVSTTNLDIAVEAGAKFIVVVNPLVPYVNDFKKRIPTITGSRARRVSDMGFPQIGYQSFKLLAYQRLHDLARRWEQRYPGVDIILVEPEPNDELMFQTSVMNFTSRVDYRASRLPVGNAEAGPRLPPLQADLRPPRNRDLGDESAQGGQALRGRARENPRLAEDPRADDLDAAASGGSGIDGPPATRGRPAGYATTTRRLSEARELLGGCEIPLGELGLLLGLRRGARDFAEAREEEGLVDAPVEDWNPPLDALDDHIAAFQTGLSCKLGGGQVNGHRSNVLLCRLRCGREVCRLGRTVSTCLSARSLYKR